MYFFQKYIVTLFYKKIRITIVVCLLRESAPGFYLHHVEVADQDLAELTKKLTKIISVTSVN